MDSDSHLATAPRGTFKSYFIGFILSIALTLAAYLLASEHLLAGRALISAIVGLGVVQVVVQLLFFLHVGSESRPRWNLLAFLFMALVLTVVVFGSLWIMSNLEYHMMSKQEVEEYMLKQEAIKKSYIKE